MHGISQRSPFRLGDVLHVEECLAHAGFVAADKTVGRRIDAAHTGFKDEVAGAGREVPGSCRFDRSDGRDRPDAIRHSLLRTDESAGEGRELW